MERITYSKEIRRAILHFMSAMDGVKIQRFDITGKVRDIIRVGMGFHPKSPIFKDATNNSGHITLPYITVKLTNIAHDSSRSWNKTHQMDSFREKENRIINYTCPVPVNLEFAFEITTAYFEDLYQILTNFIAFTNPYIYVSMQEPFTRSELRCPVEWNGAIPLNFSDELTPADTNRYKATTGFTFKTWIFKPKEESVARICCVDWGVAIEKKWQDYTQGETYEETGHISGYPEIRSIAPNIIKIGEKNTIQAIGEKFDTIHTVLLSANSSMFGPLSSHDFFPKSEVYPPIKGRATPFSATSEFLTIDVTPQNEGYFDIILVNSCGYTKLTDPRDTNTYSLSSQCDGSTQQIIIPSDNPFHSFAENCSGCPTAYDDAFQNGIYVSSPWNTACTMSECNDAIVPSAYPCD